MYYLITETLQECEKEQIKSGEAQYVAVLTPEEWEQQKDSFDMGIDIELAPTDIYSTKAEVNYDSLTGSFSIPNRQNISGQYDEFAFALDEKGIVFIDGSGASSKILSEVKKSKKWRLPSLERFLYDFLEQIVRRDRELLERYDQELDNIENDIENEKDDADLERVNDIRSEIRDLRVHYEQLLDFSQELEENENNFFKHDNLRYFRLYSSRIDRLRDTANAISDHAAQLRDIYNSQLDKKQNRIMTVLTVVTTIFMPLTLIVGWYGMNFKFMPELEAQWGYPSIIILSMLIFFGSLAFFKRIKWL